MPTQLKQLIAVALAHKTPYKNHDHFTYYLIQADISVTCGSHPNSNIMGFTYCFCGHTQALQGIFVLSRLKWPCFLYLQ